MLCVLIYFCGRHDRSAETAVVLWALERVVRVTAPRAHRTARPTYKALIDSLRRTALEHGAHTHAAAAAAAGLVTRASVVC